MGESGWREWFGECVSKLIGGVNIVDINCAIEHKLAEMVMFKANVLSSW